MWPKPMLGHHLAIITRLLERPLLTGLTSQESHQCRRRSICARVQPAWFKADHDEESYGRCRPG